MRLRGTPVMLLSPWPKYWQHGPNIDNNSLRRGLDAESFLPCPEHPLWSDGLQALKFLSRRFQQIVIYRDDTAASHERGKVQLTRTDPAHMRLRVLDTRVSELRGQTSLLPSK